MAEKTASSKILHNSFWYGLETLLETLVFLGTSVAVARYLGPEKLGYFSYINFFVQVVTRTSGGGLAGATRKYMAEFLGLGRPGTARAVYFLAYKYQLMGALAITGVALAGIALFGEPGFRLMATILIVSIVPGVMSWVPAQANNAFEDTSRNTLSALGYLFSYVVVIGLTLHFRWDLVGIASAALVGRVVEVVWRTIPLHRRLRAIPLEAMPEDLTARIRRYCLQAMGLQLLTSLVWDRSEMFFLKAFSGLDQVAFYSVSFGLANNLLVVPRTFGGATGITLMVESSRDPGRVDSIVKNASRYLLLVVFPVHLGAAAITGVALGFAYGARYAGAIPVLIVASILSMPRAFQEIAEILVRAADRQKQMLHWYIVTGVVNITLDLALIPHFGALGAAWANGLAQTFGIVAIWQLARRAYTFSLPMGTALRLGAAGLLMSGVAYFICRALGGVAGMVCAIGVAAPLYVLLVKLLHGLEAADRKRLAPLGNRLPSRVRGLFNATIAFVTPAG